LQIVVFITFSALLLIITRPLVKKRLLNTTPTTTDALIGCKAIVTEDIDNLQGLGCVKIQGKLWSARSDSGEMIPSGTSVRVLKIEGVKLIVELSK